MFTINRILCCLSLKWGILTIANVDIAISSLGIYDSEKLNLMDCYPLMLVVYAVHITGCILIIISVFRNKKFLIWLYLISIHIRLVYTSATFIWHNIVNSHLTSKCVLEYFILTISFYFWISAYSWYKALSALLAIERASATATVP